MDLFNAATMGVDPKTGTYLSKEQRVAMFRASRGQGGGTGGGNNSGRANVQPQAAIVVANKMTGIVQSLSQNFQNATQGVAEQVAQNRKDINNIYNTVEADKAAEVKAEKKETRDKKLLMGEKLRSAREKLVEGAAAAAAGLAKVGGKITDKILKPVRGFWDKLKGALLALGAAWVIDNLPEILAEVKKFSDNIGEFGETLKGALTNVRGVWSILDNIVRSILRGVRGFAKAALDASAGIRRSATNIAGRILGALGRFALSVAEKIVDGIGKVWQNVIRAFRKVPTPETPKAAKLPVGDTPETPKTPKPPVGDTPQAPKAGKGNMFSGIGNWFKNTFGGSPKPDTPPAAPGTPQLPEGAKEAKRIKWLEDALGPIKKAFPGMAKGMKGFMGLAKGVMKIVPGIGFAIDLALNKGVAGQGWTEAIMRAMGSSIVGGMSAMAGAKIGGMAGAGLGTLILPVGGTAVGAAIGAALGAIIAGMAGGAVGDMAGATVFEGVTGKERTGNDVTGSGVVSGTIGKLQGDASLSAGDTSQKVDLKLGAIADGSSTPAGMSLDDAYGSAAPQIIETPPIVKDLRTQSQPEQTVSGDVEGPPTIASSDMDMDFYRQFALKEFQLAY